MSADVTQLKANIKDLETKAQEAEKEYQAAREQAANYNDVVYSLSRKREDESKQAASIQTSRERLVERSESDEWLQNEVDQFEQRVIIHERHKDELLKQHDALRHTLQDGHESLRRKENEVGRYQEQKVNYEQQLEARQTLIRDSSQRHRIPGYEYDLDEMQITAYTDKIVKSLKEQRLAVEKVRRETEQEMAEAQALLSDLGGRRSVSSETRNTTRQQIATNEGSITACQADLDSYRVDEGAKAALEECMKDLEGRLGKAKNDDRDASREKKIQDNTAELNKMDEISKELNRDILQASRHAKDFASLDLLKRSLKESYRRLETMQEVHKDRLGALVDQQWTVAKVEPAFQTAMSRVVRETKDAEQRRDLEAQSLAQIEYRLSNVRAELKKGQVDLETSAKTIHDNIDSEPQDYEAVMAELQEGRDTRKADVDGFKHQRDFYEKAIRKARNDSHCSMCLRAFQGTDEQESFLRRVENIISKQSLKSVQEELQDLEELLRKGKQAAPSHDLWLRLTTIDIPRLEAERKELEKQREQLIAKVEDSQRVVDHHGEVKKDLDSLAKPVAEIVKYNDEVARYSAELQDLSAKQGDAGLTRNVEEVEEELELTNSKVQDLRKTAMKLASDEKRARENISTLELDLSKARNSLSVAGHQLEKKAVISRQIKELRGSNQTHRDGVQRISDQLRDLATQIAQIEAKRDDAKRRGFEKETSLQNEASALDASVNKLKLAEHNIKTYIDNGGSAKLTRSRKEIEAIQQENIRTEEEQKHVTVRINKLSEELRDQKETKRMIADNINYRTDLKDLEILRTEIAKLSDQNAEADQEHWTRQANRWHAKSNALSTEMTSKLGAARAKDDALRKNIADWETEFQSAAQDYKKAHIEVEVRIRQSVPSHKY